MPYLTPPATNPVDDLAEAFAAQLGQWASRRGVSGNALGGLQQLGRRLMLAIGEGHVCLQLAADAPSLRLLRDCGLADDGTRPADPLATPPLVVDAAGRLYLRRHHDFEIRLAADLAGRARAGQWPDPATVAHHLDALFPPVGEATDWQRVAVAQALARRLTVISGGPGTGKTTTVARLLACLLDDAPELRIALAAPTGKAAARMEESLRQRAGDFPAAIQARLPDRAATLHRLLGSHGDGGFRHHRGNPLPLDVLVVDEASMLDLAMATRLLDALPPAARLILLGDKDQLAAVEAGAVFAELCSDAGFTPAFADWLATAGQAPRAAFPPGQGPLADSVISLSHSHRFAADSGIGRLARLINAGDGEGCAAWLHRHGHATQPLAAGDGVGWLEDDGPRPGSPLLQALQAGYAPYLEALQQGDEAAPLFAAFERFRVLCAQREGGRGVRMLNTLLEDWLRRHHPHPANPGPRHPWYVGRAVMIQRNDYALGLFNGDIGLCLPAPEGGLQVVFPAGPGAYRMLPTLRLPEHSSAFALTVHKSQGSEFEAIALLLPEQDSPLLTRELLYTGLTRARRRALLAGPTPRLIDACHRRSERRSGLGSHLARAMLTET